MEEITHHFGLGATSSSSHGHLPWGSSSLNAVVAPPQQHSVTLAHSPLSLNTAPSAGNNHVLQLASKEPSSYAADVEAIKAKIISHPNYSSLLAAYLDCQKVGAPPEVLARLTAATQDLEMRQRTTFTGLGAATEPELDQFMEAYHEMLVKYREELTRPLQEAMEFLRIVETQLNSLSISGRSLRNILTSEQGSWGA